MANRKEPVCLECDDRPYMGGLCKKHYDEQRAKDIRRENARHLLQDGTFNGEFLKTPKYRKELIRLMKWYYSAVYVLQSQSGRREMPLEEAEFAIHWCISLAQELIDADIAKQNGRPIGGMYYNTHDWVWKRFRFLKAGKHSNGLPRSK